MKKKPRTRPTELDRIVKQLRTVLRRRTSDVVLAGNLLIEARKLFANEHGEWQEWLTENFDLSLRTAQNYCAAAEYVARAKGKSATVADFANLSPTVLYHLAADHFDERVEAAILAEARKRRVGEDAMWAICEKLAPPDDADADDADDQEDGDEDRHDSGDEKDAESEAILDGPPPAVPPTAPNSPPTDYALRDFDQAISTLKRLMTNPAQFASSTHSANDLEQVESFLRAVTNAKAKAKATAEATS